MQTDRDRVAPDGLDVSLGQVDGALVQVRAASLLDGRDDVCRTDRTEELALVARGPRGQRHGAKRLDLGLQLVGVVEVANRLHFTGPTDLVGLALGAAGRDDGEATGQQVVASVAVLDLDGVTGLAQMVDLGGENQLHVRLLYRVAELNGSSATSRAFFTAIAMSRWCWT